MSRISATAQVLGLSVRQARTPSELVMLARTKSPGGFILDLQNPGLTLPALLAELRRVCADAARDGLWIARREGVAPGGSMMPARPGVAASQFVRMLDGHLKEWLGDSTGEAPTA